MILVILLLITIIGLLIAYNIYVKKNVAVIEKSKRRLDDLSVLNSLIQISGTLRPVDQKLTMINNMLIEKFLLDYSTIVTFDGKAFNIKATNAEPRIADEIKTVYKEDIFKNAIQTRAPKYISVEVPEDQLPYLKEQKDRVKTAIFFPLYFESVFIGFWLIESKKIQAFKNLDLEIMMQVKDRILDLIKTMSFQSNIENMIQNDKFSSLKTAEYLFTEGKNKLDAFNTSTVIMLRIANLEKINKEYSREAGNMTITNVIKAVMDELDEKLERQYIFVRYLGPTFAIAFPGKTPDELKEIIQRIKIVSDSTMVLLSELDEKDVKENVKVKEEIKLNQDKEKTKKATNKKEDDINDIINTNDESDKEIIPDIILAVAKYYRGTAIEILSNELIKYLNQIAERKIDYKDITYM